ncbi:MAG: uroporphyrinogen-III synthase [Acidobacteriaceae bacterium]
MRPLGGRKILITRARRQAQSLATALEEKGATVLAIPAIEIVPPDSYNALDMALGKAQDYQWLVVTSVNGAEVLAQRLAFLRIASSALDHLKIAAIGPSTARSLGTAGLRVDELPRQSIAESLVESLRDQVAGQKVLLVRAKVARDVIPEELRNAGAVVDVVDAYQTVVPAGSSEALRLAFAAPDRVPDAVTFTSSSTVSNFFRLLHEAGLQGWPTAMAAASIGPVTSQTLRRNGIEPAIEAAEYTIPGLVAALCRWAAAREDGAK